MNHYDYLKIEHEDHLSIVTLNRPQACNALNYQFLEEIEHCALGFRDNAQSRVVIFTGAGKHFSAGADLKEFEDPNTDSMVLKRRRLRMGERVLQAILGMDQITICAWNGGAIGGGGCIATTTDFRIGGENCFLYYPEIELGVNLIWQSLPRTVRLVGETRALRLAIGAEKVNAQELHEWGLIEKLLPEDELLDGAREFASIYLARAPIAAQMIKRSVNAIGRQLDGAVMHMDADQHYLVSTSEDHKRAVEAYVNKRSPDFTGD
ncbi:MAG: enoyl-CoA hydratase/isomerase family protein [Gammaproteobacteria bacterium]